MASTLLLAAQSRLGDKAEAILEAGGLSPVRCRDRVEFERRAAEHAAAVLVVPELGCNRWIGWVDSLGERHATLRVVLATGPEPTNLCLLGRVKV